MESSRSRRLGFSEIRYHSDVLHYQRGRWCSLTLPGSLISGPGWTLPVTDVKVRTTDLGVAKQMHLSGKRKRTTLSSAMFATEAEFDRPPTPDSDAAHSRRDGSAAVPSDAPFDVRQTTPSDRLIAEMLQTQGPVSSAISSLEDMDEARLAEFYQILANFYRGKPWNMVAGDQIFEIHCEAWQPARWAACVMGQLGQEFGIALYDTPAAAMEMLENPDPSFTGSDTLVVHFNEDFDAVPVDCWYRERNNWALAGPEAHPFAARFTDGELKAIQRRDIDVIMQTLPHVPRFYAHPADHTLTVGEGKQQLTFHWLT